MLGVTVYRGDGEGRDCVVHAACIVMFLFLGERSAADEVNSLHRSIILAFGRCSPHIEGRPEFSYLSLVGHFGPVFQNAEKILASEEGQFLVKEICSW